MVVLGLTPNPLPFLCRSVAGVGGDAGRNAKVCSHSTQSFIEIVQQTIRRQQHNSTKGFWRRLLGPAPQVLFLPYLAEDPDEESDRLAATRAHAKKDVSTSFRGSEEAFLGGRWSRAHKGMHSLAKLVAKQIAPAGNARFRCLGWKFKLM
jgi:hypothetical protein